MEIIFVFCRGSNQKVIDIHIADDSVLTNVVIVLPLCYDLGNLSIKFINISN